jgi:DNA-binding CsgD family transcriptional regulator
MDSGVHACYKTMQTTHILVIDSGPMHDREPSSGEVQFVDLGLDPLLIQGATYYLEESANDQHEDLVANLAEILESSSEQAEIVLAHLRPLVPGLAIEPVALATHEVAAPPVQPAQPKPKQVVNVPHPVDQKTETAAREVEPSAAYLALENSQHADVNYSDRLYQHYRQNPGQKLGDLAVRAILQHFPGWKYETAWKDERHVHTQVRMLRRIITDSSVALDLPEAIDSDRRRVIRDKEGLTIKVDDVRGVDLLCMLAIEGIVSLAMPPPDVEPRPNAKKETVILPGQFSEEVRKFRGAKNIYVHEDDLVTDKESIALSLITHFDTTEDISRALEVSAATVSNYLKVVRKRFNLSSSGAISNIELMLAAIATGTANTDHIAKDMTSVLDDAEKTLLACYFSPDPAIREASRHQRRSKSSTHIQKIYSKLHAKRHMAVLYGVKDGVIELPSLEDIRTTVAKNRAHE